MRREEAASARLAFGALGLGILAIALGVTLGVETSAFQDFTACDSGSCLLTPLVLLWLLILVVGATALLLASALWQRPTRTRRVEPVARPGPSWPRRSPATLALPPVRPAAGPSRAPPAAPPRSTPAPGSGSPPPEPPPSIPARSTPAPGPGSSRAAPRPSPPSPATAPAGPSAWAEDATEPVPPATRRPAAPGRPASSATPAVEGVPIDIDELMDELERISDEMLPAPSEERPSGPRARRPPETPSP